MRLAKLPFPTQIIRDRATSAPPRSKSLSVGGELESLGGSGEEPDIDEVYSRRGDRPGGGGRADQLQGQ